MDNLKILHLPTDLLEPRTDDGLYFRTRLRAHSAHADFLANNPQATR